MDEQLAYSMPLLLLPLHFHLFWAAPLPTRKEGCVGPWVRWQRVHTTRSSHHMAACAHYTQFTTRSSQHLAMCALPFLSFTCVNWSKPFPQCRVHKKGCGLWAASCKLWAVWAYLLIPSFHLSTLFVAQANGGHLCLQ
jgi:hypothetical protein